MPDRRVAVTGLGTVCAGGIGIDSLWQSLCQGQQCTRTIDLFDASEFSSSVGGQIDDFSARKFVPKNYRKAVKVMARDIEIAVAAADLAFKDAGISTRGTDDGEMTIPASRLGCNIGAGLIACDLDELGAAASSAVTDGLFDLKAWGKEGLTNLTPLWLLKYLPNMLSCHVTIIHGAEGPSNTITCESASGLLSVAEAARWIQRGEADAVIAGGAESKLNPMGLLRQDLTNRLSVSGNDTPAQACKPFDANHSGTVIGEGGALLILEDLEQARKRGAKIYAELVGFGSACDPEGMDITKPSAGCLDLAAKRAMEEAGVSPSQIGMITTLGTGVAGEDECESAAWKKAFGDNLSGIPAMSLTGAVGHTFAGCSALTASVAAKALSEQTIPTTVNFQTPQAGCQLNLLTETTQAQFEYAIVGAHSVGGQSTACVLKRYES